MWICIGEALKGLGQLIEAMAYYMQAVCMVLGIYKQEHPRITQYFNNLISILSKVDDQTLIQQVKAEVLPLCSEVLGAEHALTQQLRKAGE